MKKFIEDIKENYIKDHINNEEKNKFILKAIENNINHNVLSKSDVARAARMLEILKNKGIDNTLAFGAVFSCILYEEIQKGNFKNYMFIIQVAILNISTAITDYLIFRIDEVEVKSIINKEIEEVKRVVK